MTRPVKGCPTQWSKQEGAEEPETNVSVPQKGGQADATKNKAIADDNPNVDYKSEGSDPDIEAVDEEEKNSDSEYVKMELP